MKKGHFLFEITLMCISAIMLIILMINPNTFILFLAWQVLLGLMQFIHALILTFYFKNDFTIRKALRTYWFITGLVFVALAFRNQQWFPVQLGVFGIYVLPWFNAIYLTMLTYRYSIKTVNTKI